jgi:flagellin-like protein
MTTPSLPSFIFRKKNSRSRRGISPVIATTIILAITIALGLGLWGFANSGVGTATVQYSEAVTEYGDIVRNHRFIIANMDFNNPGSNQVAFWIYNNGKLDATINPNNIFMICTIGCALGFDPAPASLVFAEDGSTDYTVAPKTLKKFYFTTTLESGAGIRVYELTVASDEGLTQTYVKTKSG